MSGALPVVSVLVPVYNSAGTLERSLRSAMAQTLREIEIIVADDGSTDDSGDVARRVAAEDKRIMVLRLLPNRGKSAAMNRMTAMARGAWIAVLDADDAYAPDRLARLVAAAEGAGVDMAADNLAYRDAGIGRVVRTGFDPASPARVLGLDDLLRDADSFADFDYGVLKPVIRRSFIEQHGLRYIERAKLAEDFYYLLGFMAAGGRCMLLPQPTYEWTMPFGMVSRQWTGTGDGPWRYDYRHALKANALVLGQMRERNQHAIVAMLERRSRQYHVMAHYLDAQRHLAEGRWLRCIACIATHPSTFGLLLARIAGRVRRGLTGGAASRPAHP